MTVEDVMKIGIEALLAKQPPTKPDHRTSADKQ